MQGALPASAGMGRARSAPVPCAGASVRVRARSEVGAWGGGTSGVAEHLKGARVGGGKVVVEVGGWWSAEE